MRLLYMAALRTQIYLSAGQRAALDELRKRRGLTLAEAIREAVDRYLASEGEAPEEVYARTFGSVPGLARPPIDEWAEREARAWRE